MTDMRNFHSTPSNDTHAHTVLVDSDDVIAKDRYALEEDGAGLGQFHYSGGEYAENQNGTAKVLGALVIALMVGSAGAYVYATMPAQQQDVVANADLPRPMGPGATAAMTPPATAPAMDALSGDTSNNTPEATAMDTPAAPVTAPAPTRTAQAPVTPAPATPAPVTVAPAPAAVTPPVAPVMPQTQASAIPEPVSPTPPASAIAGNPPLNEQSAAPVEAAPAIPVEAAPAAAEPAQPASPAAPAVTPSEPAQPIQ